MAKVCFFRLGAAPLFIPGSTRVFGGAEVRAFTFARAMAGQLEHQVLFAVAAERNLPDHKHGVELRSVPRGRSMVKKLYSSIRRRITARPLPYDYFHLLSADVVACFGVHDPTASVIEAARQSSTRSMLFLTSSEDVRADDEGSAKERLHRDNHRYAIRHADMIVAQTEYQRQKLLERFGRESTLIRNPIDTQIEPDLNRVPRHALWIGRADRDSKRADICFSIARRRPHIPFTIVMNDSSREVYRNLTGALPRNVTLHRHVPLDQIELLFATASVLVNTSESEGFPNTFLQAAKFGVPIVSLRVDPDGMLTERGCGVVAGSELQLAELVFELHSGSEDTIRMSNAAREYVARYHELTARAHELSQAISMLCSKRQAA